MRDGRTDNEQLKIELLSQWKLEAEFRNLTTNSETAMLSRSTYCCCSSHHPPEFKMETWNLIAVIQENSNLNLLLLLLSSSARLRLAGRLLTPTRSPTGVLALCKITLYCCHRFTFLYRFYRVQFHLEFAPESDPPFFFFASLTAFFCALFAAAWFCSSFFCFS